MHFVHLVSHWYHFYKKIWAQLFKTNDVVSLRIVKTLIIKYGKYANIFAEKMWVAFAKATHIFSEQILVN